MSRLTFRDKQPEVCWQKLKRDDYNDEGIPPLPHTDVKQAEVRRVSRKLAEQIILKYEWLGTMVSTSQHYGIFFGDYCAGVCCVGIKGGGANIYAHKEFNLNNGELAYLARGACVHWAPKGTNSKLISWTCRLLGYDTNSKIVIAYSDTDAGEIGTVYQACNWVYIGKGAAGNQWVSPDGRVYSQKTPYGLKMQKGGTHAYWTQKLRNEGWTEQKSNPKHKYVYIIDNKDKELVWLVESKRQPYPKRPKQATSNTN